jgi:hypothetical protein
MALRSNHYDAAFEAFLRTERRPYVAVDEARRALTADASIKSFDFIVYSVQGRNLLIDVKGRKFPTGPDGHGQRWENWATEEDVESLLRWQRLFGGDFRAALVFAYDIAEPRWHDQHPRRWEFRQRTYAFYGVWADEYAGAMRGRSRAWDTVTVPRREYLELRRPIAELL